MTEKFVYDAVTAHAALDARLDAAAKRYRDSLGCNGRADCTSTRGHLSVCPKYVRESA